MTLAPRLPDLPPAPLAAAWAATPCRQRALIDLLVSTFARRRGVFVCANGHAYKLHSLVCLAREGLVTIAVNGRGPLHARAWLTPRGRHHARRAAERLAARPPSAAITNLRVIARAMMPGGSS